MSEKFEIEGLREVDAALEQLSKSTGKAVLRRVLKARAQPIADAAEANATRRSGALAASAAVSTKLSKQQKRLHRKMFRDDRAAVEVFAGFGSDPAAVMEEFGSVHNAPPNPALRPAWDANKHGVLDGIEKDLAQEIEKSAARARRKAAKQALK